MTPSKLLLSDALDDLYRLLVGVYLCDGPVAFCVYVYYVHGIYTLPAGAWIIPGVIVTLVTTIITGLFMEKIGRLSGYTQIGTPISGVLCLACAIIADVLIAIITMVYARESQ